MLDLETLRFVNRYLVLGTVLLLAAYNLGYRMPTWLHHSLMVAGYAMLFATVILGNIQRFKIPAMMLRH
jgi:hypothetical protein